MTSLYTAEKRPSQIPASPFPCVQCIPWFQTKPQTTQTTQKTSVAAPSLSVYSVCSVVQMVSRRKRYV